MNRMWLVLAYLAIAASTMVKLVIANLTQGQDDVFIWLLFANGVRDAGVTHVYSEIAMNHPPLAAWLLWAINQLRNEMPFPFLVRAPTALADVVTLTLLLNMLRRRRGTRFAAICTLLAATSPVLIVQSGFHGNWDSLVVMFVVTSLYLAGQRHWYFAAGLALAAGLSIKLVPVVLLPAFVVWCARHSPRAAMRFIAGGAVIFSVFWVPVLLVDADAIVHNVLGYSGANTPRQWGIVPVLDLVVGSGSLVDFIVSPGRFIFLLISAGLPTFLLYRRKLDLCESVALSMSLLLFTLVAWAPQYLSWPVVLGYFLVPRAITLYQAAASTFTLFLYSHWTGQPVGSWYQARYQDLSGIEWPLMMVTWLALGAVCAAALVPALASLARRETQGVSPSVGGRHLIGDSVGFSEVPGPAPVAQLRDRQGTQDWQEADSTKIDAMACREVSTTHSAEGRVRIDVNAVEGQVQT